jgi:hypothetical protein
MQLVLAHYIASGRVYTFVTDPARKNVESCPSDNLVALPANAGAPRSVNQLRSAVFRILSSGSHSPFASIEADRVHRPGSRAILRTRFMLLLALFQHAVRKQDRGVRCPGCGLYYLGAVHRERRELAKPLLVWARGRHAARCDVG